MKLHLPKTLFAALMTAIVAVGTACAADDIVVTGTMNVSNHTEYGTISFSGNSATLVAPGGSASESTTMTADAITATTGGTATINTGGWSSLIVAGKVTVDNGTTLKITGPGFTAGSIDVLNGSTLQMGWWSHAYTDTINLNGSNLTRSEDSTFGTTENRIGTVNVSGTSSVYALTATEVVLKDGAALTTNATTMTDLTAEAGASSIKNTSAVNITVASGATLTLNGSTSFSNAIDNSGTVIFGTRTVTFNGTSTTVGKTVASGETLTVNSNTSADYAAGDLSALTTGGNVEVTLSAVRFSGGSSLVVNNEQEMSTGDINTSQTQRIVLSSIKAGSTGHLTLKGNIGQWNVPGYFGVTEWLTDTEDGQSGQITIDGEYYAVDSAACNTTVKGNLNVTGTTIIKGGATMTVTNADGVNGILTTGKLVLHDWSDSVKDTLDITGGVVNVTSESKHTDAPASKDAVKANSGIVVGCWNNASSAATINVTGGGVLNAVDSTTVIGWESAGKIIIGADSEANLYQVNQTGQSATGELHLDGGRLNLGAGGYIGTSRTEGTSGTAHSSLQVDAGSTGSTIGTLSTETVLINENITLNSGVTIDTTVYEAQNTGKATTLTVDGVNQYGTINLAGNISGTGAITIDGEGTMGFTGTDAQTIGNDITATNGTLAVSGGAKTFTGTVDVKNLEASSNVTATSLALESGAALTLGKDVILKTASLTIKVDNTITLGKNAELMEGTGQKELLMIRGDNLSISTTGTEATEVFGANAGVTVSNATVVLFGPKDYTWGATLGTGTYIQNNTDSKLTLTGTGSNFGTLDLGGYGKQTVEFTQNATVDIIKGSANANESGVLSLAQGATLQANNVWYLENVLNKLTGDGVLENSSNVTDLGKGRALSTIAGNYVHKGTLGLDNSNGYSSEVTVSGSLTTKKGFTLTGGTAGSTLTVTGELNAEGGIKFADGTAKLQVASDKVNLGGSVTAEEGATGHIEVKKGNKLTISGATISDIDFTSYGEGEIDATIELADVAMTGVTITGVKSVVSGEMTYADVTVYDKQPVAAAATTFGLLLSGADAEASTPTLTATTVQTGGSATGSLTVDLAELALGTWTLMDGVDLNGLTISFGDTLQGIAENDKYEVSLMLDGTSVEAGTALTQTGSTVTLTVSAANVPEPATGVLSLLALAGLAARRRRKH